MSPIIQKKFGKKLLNIFPLNPKPIKVRKKAISSEQPKLWKTYSPISILEEAKKTWYKVNNGKLAIGDSNVTEPNKFQLFSSNGKIIEGQFIKQGNNWIEVPKNADYYFTFREVYRDQKWIHLHDVTRNYSARLPFKLEFMLLRTGKSFYKYKPVLPLWE